jgi:hypothetical protein
MESELVGADDASPVMMLTRYFMEVQGFAVDESDLYQDNLSTMLLERNGNKSSSKRTKHINIRYFFIKDRIASNEISVKHCPTAEMMAGHFTKQLQGAPFHKFRAEIQGIPADTTDANLGGESIKECETKQLKEPKCDGQPGKDEKGYGATAHHSAVRGRASISASELHSSPVVSRVIPPPRGRS